MAAVRFPNRGRSQQQCVPDLPRGNQVLSRLLLGLSAVWLLFAVLLIAQALIGFSLWGQLLGSPKVLEPAEQTQPANAPPSWAVAMFKGQMSQPQADMLARQILASPYTRPNGEGNLNGAAFGKTCEPRTGCLPRSASVVLQPPLLSSVVANQLCSDAGGWVTQFTNRGARELFADEHLAVFQPVWEQQRALACPGCNAWVFNSLVSPDGKGTAEWHRDDTFSLANVTAEPMGDRLVPKQVSVLYLVMPSQGGGLAVSHTPDIQAGSVLTFTPEAGDTVVFDGRLPHAVMPFPQAEGGAQLPRVTLVCEHYMLNATELQGVTKHLKLPGITAAPHHGT